MQLGKLTGSLHFLFAGCLIVESNSSYVITWVSKCQDYGQLWKHNIVLNEICKLCKFLIRNFNHIMRSTKKVADLLAKTKNPIRVIEIVR